MFLFQIVAIVEFKRQAVGVARQVFLYDAAERAVANEESHGGVYGNLASLGQRCAIAADVGYKVAEFRRHTLYPYVFDAQSGKY